MNVQPAFILQATVFQSLQSDSGLSCYGRHCRHPNSVKTPVTPWSGCRWKRGAISTTSARRSAKSRSRSCRHLGSIVGWGKKWGKFWETGRALVSMTSKQRVHFSRCCNISTPKDSPDFRDERNIYLVNESQGWNMFVIVLVWQMRGQRDDSLFCLSRRIARTPQTRSNTANLYLP